jgi:hypothetical protein
MSITKAELLSFANSAYDASYSGTDLDEALSLLVDDLANMHVLLDEDTSQSLSSGSLSLSYPSDALDTDRAIKEIVLTNASSVRQAPLKWLPGGWNAYHKCMEGYNSATGGTPTYFVCHDRTIYVYPVPNGAFTSSINYYKRHGAITGTNPTISFGDSWKKLMKYGLVYFWALMKANSEYVALWESRYLAEKERMRGHIPRDMGIAGATYL